ncbi:hypothetical protein EV426DRAFT_704473 [Tirmania nivea]|nr:hypothetical protein EV426DRAFT_704473 [Tirmania nivea]
MTKLPHSKYIKVDQLRMFDGNPAELDSFDNAIKQWCIRTNMPLYHGGTAAGDPESDYEYVSQDNPDGVSNYMLGKRLVAAISSRFEKTALKWWEDYDSNEVNPYPNYGVPEGMEEVLLRDPLKKVFNADVDASEAELELERFTWKPLEPKGMNVTVVQGHIERLMKRAGKVGSFQRVRCIRNCLPQKFRDKVEMAETEEKLWKKIRELTSQCSGCGKAGHTLVVCRKNTTATTTANPSNPLNPSNPAEKPPLCPVCKRGCHEAKNCYTIVGRRGEEKPKANTPSATPKPTQQATSNQDANQEREKQDLKQATLTFVSQQKSCYQCGEKGHIARFCSNKASVPAAFVAPDD